MTHRIFADRDVVIGADLTEVWAEVDTLVGDIATLQLNDASDAATLATLTSHATTVDGQIAALQTSETADAANIGTLQTHATTVDSEIATLQSQISTLQQSGGSSGSGGGGFVTVAAVDAPAAVRGRADYVCDGIADDVEINAALSASRAVLLAGTTFTISNPVLIRQHGQMLVGQGVAVNPANSDGGGGTLIRLDATLADYSAFTNGYLIDVDAPSGGTTPRARVTLKDFGVFGANKGTNVSGIHFRGHQGHVDHVFVSSMSGHGVVFEGFSVWEMYNTRMWGCEVHHNSGHGIWCTANNVGDDHFVDNQTYNNGGDGFRADGSSHQIVNHHSYANGGSGIYVGGLNTKLVNCKLETNNPGILIDGVGGTQISNCNFKGNAPDAQIHVNASSYQGLITGCKFHATDNVNGVQAPNYALYFADNATFSVADCRIGGTYLVSNMRLPATHNNIKIANVVGYTNQNRGTFATDGTSTSFTFAHGLSLTPAKCDVVLVPQFDPGAVRWWVSAVDAANVTVSFSAAPAAGTVSWQANSE